MNFFAVTSSLFLVFYTRLLLAENVLLEMIHAIKGSNDRGPENTRSLELITLKESRLIIILIISQENPIACVFEFNLHAARFKKNNYI